MTDTTSKRKRGEGSIFRDAGSQTWRIKYSDHGKTHRESSGSSDHKVAEKLLKRRLAEITTGTFTPRLNVRVDELIADVQADYANSGRKSAAQIRGRWRLHLEPFFGRRRACDIGSDLLQRYVNHRRGEGASPASVNRELSLLRRAFHLARRSTPPKVMTVPFFPMQREAEARRGFLESSQYDRLAEECGKTGLWLRAIFEWGVTYGWRLRELTGKGGLKVEQVDFVNGTIRWRPAAPRTATAGRSA